MTIKILLADDQCLIVEGIKSILKHESEIEVVGTAYDGHSAIAQVKKLQPDIALIDIEMPKMNGITATKYICEYLPHTRVIVLTSHKSPIYIAQALQAGASGYLLKDTLLEDLKQAIYSLGRGYSYIEAKLLTQAVNRAPTVNVNQGQKKVTYLKKYRKNIYNPSPKRRGRQSLWSKIVERKSTSKSTKFGTNKANQTPIFDSPTYPTVQELFPTEQNLPNLRFHHSHQFNRQGYLKRIAWLSFAIASFVLSVIIF